MHLRDLQKANKYFHPGYVWVFFPIGVFCRLNKHQHFYQDAARIDTWKQVSFGISRRRTCYTEELTKGEYSRSKYSPYSIVLICLLIDKFES